MFRTFDFYLFARRNVLNLGVVVPRAMYRLAFAYKLLSVFLIRASARGASMWLQVVHWFLLKLTVYRTLDAHISFTVDVVDIVVVVFIAVQKTCLLDKNLSRVQVRLCAPLDRTRRTTGTFHMSARSLPKRSVTRVAADLHIGVFVLVLYSRVVVCARSMLLVRTLHEILSRERPWHLLLNNWQRKDVDSDSRACPRSNRILAACNRKTDTSYL